MGSASADFELETISYVTGSPPLPDPYISSAQALQGTIVEVISDWGSVYPNVLIKKVRPDPKEGKQPLLFNTGGVMAPAVRVKLLWSCVRVG